MFVTFCLGSWSMMLSQVTTGAAGHTEYHGAIPCPVSPPPNPAHSLPTPCPAGATIPSAPNITAFHEAQAARLRAAEDALRDSVTREAGLRGQVSAMLAQLEQAKAPHTLGSGGAVPPANSITVAPPPDGPRGHVTPPPAAPPHVVPPPAVALPVAPLPPSSVAQASTAMAMAPYAEDITAKFPELEACLKNEETGQTTCVSPDIQFRTGWMVHLVPQDNPGKGWRFHHLIAQGLAKHPYVNLTSDMGRADAVIWLPTSTGQPPNAVPPKAKFLILDEGDGAGYVPKAQSMNYIAYFKRSWAKKNNGKVSIESRHGQC